MKDEAARSVLCRHWAGEPRPYAGKIIIYGPLVGADLFLRGGGFCRGNEVAFCQIHSIE